MISFQRTLIMASLVSWGVALAPIAKAEVPVVDLTQSPSRITSQAPVAIDSLPAPDVENQAIASSNTGATTDSSSLSSLPLEQRVTILQRQVANMTQVVSQNNRLREDIDKLRGQVETQAHDLKQLQEQVRTQYEDIDQRLTKTTAGKATDITTPVKKDVLAKSTTTDSSAVTDSGLTANEPDKASQNAKTPAVASAEEQSAYKAATELVKKGDFVRATTAFQKMSRKFPNGEHAVDVHYWLGEIYLAQGQPDSAVSEFQTVITRWSSNSKVPNAVYKLGVAYADKGESKKAEVQLKKVLKQYPKSSAAQLAKTRLETLKSNK